MISQTRIDLYWDENSGLSGKIVSGQTLNQHDRNNRLIILTPRNFRLAETQSLWIGFTDSMEEIETATRVGFTRVGVVDGAYTIGFPETVAEKRGEWYLCCCIRENYDAAKNRYEAQTNTVYLTLEVYASMRDALGRIPSYADMDMLYQTVLSAARRLEERADELEKRFAEMEEALDGR